MGKTVALSIESLEGHLLKTNQSVQHIIELVQNAVKTADSLSAEGGVQDATIANVVNKLSGSAEALKTVPAELESLSRILKQKSDDILEAQQAAAAEIAEV